MKKEKFITVMAVLDDDAQILLQSIQEDLERLYGEDTKTKDIPYHITLGSYAVEETDAVISKIKEVDGKTEPFAVRFSGLNHFGNYVRFVDPEMNNALLSLHGYFDSDYANGFDTWVPHVTVYRHTEAREIELTEELLAKLEKLTEGTIIGIELGEFFPPKKIIRVMFP